MKIGGIQKTSLIEYPGMISCIIFLQGCNLRCPYCYNPELVLPERFITPLDTEEIIFFFGRRKKYLEGIVITGGEPCLNDDLPAFAKTLKQIGYYVKIDTNGTAPGILKRMLEERLVDYVAMDVKAPAGKYESVAGVPVDMGNIAESVDIVKKIAPAYEFRTTVVKELLAPEDFNRIGNFISGARLYYIQKFVRSPKIISSYRHDVEKFTAYSEVEFEEIRNTMLKYVSECRVR